MWRFSVSSPGGGSSTSQRQPQVQIPNVTPEHQEVKESWIWPKMFKALHDYKDSLNTEVSLLTLETAELKLICAVPKPSSQINRELMRHPQI